MTRDTGSAADPDPAAARASTPDSAAARASTPDPAAARASAPDPAADRASTPDDATERASAPPGTPGPNAESSALPSPDRLTEAVTLMARIRREGRWESAQTHASLLPYLIEESWELVDAVADDDRDQLVSELGDLLLQVLFHSAIGADHETEPFDVQDVAGALLDKLRRRAPYWFAEDGADGLDAAEQDRLWQEAKAAERRAAENSGRAARGVVDDISWDQPALALGQKVLGSARAAGFPDELVPEQMRLVPVDPVGVFHESGSAEVAYRRVVREFADQIRAAEARLAVPASEATPADWHLAWRT